MLNWWLGRPAEGGRVQDDDPNEEPPETPAPVFAARALKSALFGTPAPSEDETIYDVESPSVAVAAKNSITSQERSLSPVKPQGILLTPGTATARRKTVSFGNEVVDKEVVKTSSKRKRKTSLTQSLENARGVKFPDFRSKIVLHPSESQLPLDQRSQSTETATFDAHSDYVGSAASEFSSGRPSKSQRSNQDPIQDFVDGDGPEGDATVDLNKPFSQSGKFWKSEYEQYHEQAKKEMERLVGYKSLAKSYAKMKDTEAAELAEKLKEEQRKVVSMEDKVSQLSSRIAAVGLEGDDEESPELLKELARQTALALQYKSQVEEFRVVLEGNDKDSSNRQADEKKRFTSPRTEQTLLDTHRELKKAREQLRDMALLRDQMDELRKTLATTEKTAMRLHGENARLTEELLHTDLRLETHLEKCEKKRKSSIEQRQRKDEAFSRLQKDYDKLKEQAKSQRRDAEQLLKKRHDQVVELKKEIASLHGSNSNAQEFQQALQKKSVEYDETVAYYKKQIEEMKHGSQQRSEQVVDLQAVGEASGRYTKTQTSKAHVPIESSYPRESLIPVPSQPISRPSKTMPPSKPLRSETPTGSPRSRSSHSALSEIVNSASVDSIPPQGFGLGPVQHTPQIKLTPLTNRLSNLSLDSPLVDLPSSEPSLPFITGRAIHERNFHTSPRPSMFNIASSPPKAAMIRSRASDEVSRQRSNNELAARRHANIASSRLSSMEGSKMKSALPPERAAAAKARLEQKQADKRKAQALGADKENIRT